MWLPDVERASFTSSRTARFTIRRCETASWREQLQKVLGDGAVTLCWLDSQARQC